MERYSSRPPRQGGAPQGDAASNQEDFTEMVDATARRPGVFGKLLIISLIIVSVAVTAFVGYAIVQGVGSQSLIDGNKYQAVFLSDGQIYFGKLSNTDKQYTVLEDIYYLQVQDGAQVQQAGTEAEPSITLRKLGNEIHGPVDEMVINSDQILFWENLKDDGQVAKAIVQYQESDGATDTTTGTTTDTTEGTIEETP